MELSSDPAAQSRHHLRTAEGTPFREPWTRRFVISDMRHHRNTLTYLLTYIAKIVAIARIPSRAVRVGLSEEKEMPVWNVCPLFFSSFPSTIPLSFSSSFISFLFSFHLPLASFPCPGDPFSWIQLGDRSTADPDRTQPTNGLWYTLWAENHPPCHSAIAEVFRQSDDEILQKPGMSSLALVVISITL